LSTGHDSILVLGPVLLLMKCRDGSQARVFFGAEPLQAKHPCRLLQHISFMSILTRENDFTTVFGRDLGRIVERAALVGS